MPTYDSPFLSWTFRNPASTDFDPNALGGTFVLEVGEGSGGLVTSAPTLAQFIGTHAVWLSGPREPNGSTRYGEFEGTFAGIQSRSSGFDIAFLLNRHVPGPMQNPLRDAIGAVVDRLAAGWGRGLTDHVENQQDFSVLEALGRSDRVQAQRPPISWGDG